MRRTDNLTIGFVGAGGDGVVMLGSLLQRLSAEHGYFGQMPLYYGAQIRGGGSALKLNFNSQHPYLPNDDLDILVVFNWEKYGEFKGELHTTNQTLILCEHSPADEVQIRGCVCNIKFAEMSKQMTGEPRNKNILALGLVTGLVGMELAKLSSIIMSDEYFRLVKKNHDVFEYGFKLCTAESGQELPKFQLVQPMDQSPNKILCGNDLIVEGAMTAGCRACFGYPITPASEIAEDMKKRLASIGGAWRQSEDEIAAIMNGIGASLTGVKTLVPTSGPGFSLMTEALGLASGMEVPLVLVDVQRGGPSTGAPTKPEQSDLFHAVYGGHGDSFRIVVAPHDLESVYRLTVDAFNLSEYYQVPVVLLTDQFLGQTPTAINGNFMNKKYRIVNRRKISKGSTEPYKRYEETPDRISPMSDIGDADGIYQTSGLCHREDGSHDSSLDTVSRWHKKISEKLEPLKDMGGRMQFYGNPFASDRIITWGSTAQAVREAITSLGLNHQVGICLPELISPLPAMAAKFVEDANRLMVIEMNASGQFYRYLRSVAYPPRNTVSYHRSGSRPFGLEELKTAIKDAFGKKEAE